MESKETVIKIYISLHLQIHEEMIYTILLAKIQLLNSNLIFFGQKLKGKSKM